MLKLISPDYKVKRSKSNMEEVLKQLEEALGSEESLPITRRQIKRCAIVGDHQAQALFRFLLTNTCFPDHYAIHRVIDIHLTGEERIRKFLEDDLPRMDLIIHQLTDLTEETLKHLGPQTQSVVFPSCHFRGYFPELIHLFDSEGSPLLVEGLEYHDRYLLRHFIQRFRIEAGKSTDQINPKERKSFLEEGVRLFEDLSLITKDEAQRFVEESIREIEEQEEKCQVRISDYLRAHYRQKRLFNTPKHPSQDLMSELTRRILIHLDLGSEVDSEEVIPRNPLFPLYPVTRKHLNLEFKEEPIWETPGRSLNRCKMVQVYLDFYLKSEAEDLLQNQ